MIDEGPVVHIQPMGRMANLMCQYLSARSISDAVPGCRIANIELPEWGISCPPISQETTRVVKILDNWQMEVDVRLLAYLLRSGAADRVELHTYAQHTNNYPPLDICRRIFPPQEVDVPVFGADTLVINVRAGEIADGDHPPYVMIQPWFYKDLADKTGLKLVFMGQTHPFDYTNELRATFPAAQFLPSLGPMQDFQLMRNAKNLVCSVSTYAWLAAWLSNADTIYMPLSGLFQPFQYPRHSFIPPDDERFRYFLFPWNFAVPPSLRSQTHEALNGTWRELPASAIKALRDQYPRFSASKRSRMLAFNEEEYLSAYRDVADAVKRGQFASGLAHFAHAGVHERWRHPCKVDEKWYVRTYPHAAMELGQGDYRDAAEHYVEVGRERGYRPRPPEEATARG